MRSLSILKTGLAAMAAGLLAGCLVSEEPVLDARSGGAKPLADGPYAVCETGDSENGCTVFEVSRRDDGTYAFKAEGEDPAVFRFRRIARKAYAAQSAEEGGYAYYYGAGDSEEFSLTMMLCDELPDDLRAHLIDKGDLSTDDEDFESCTVNTVKGLVEAAKAYRSGATTGDKEAKIVLRPAPDETGD
jgi:hypothetical protein